MPRWIYQPPYSLLDLLAALAVVTAARFILPPLFAYSFTLHPQKPSIGALEIVEIVVVLVVLVFLVSTVIEPLRKKLKSKKD